MLQIARYIGQSLVLTTEQGEIVVKVDHVENLNGRVQVYLCLSAPKDVKITREPW